MAVIGRIRKHSVILLVIVALALLAFIVGDLKKPSNKIYSSFIQVGKTKISYLEFEERYNHYHDLVRQQNGGTLSHEDEYQLRDNIYNELVDSVTLYSQMNALGISVTTDELRDLVAGENPNMYARRFFSDANGNYSSQLAQGFLDNMSQYDSNIVKAYMDLERYVEKEALNNKYFSLLAKGSYMPKAFAGMGLDEEETTSDVLLVQVPYGHASVSDDKVNVSDKEVQKWYDENKYRFVQEEEWRNLEYVMFPIEPSTSDLAAIERDFREQFEEFKTAENPRNFISRMVDSRYDSTYYKQGELPAGLDSIVFRMPVGSYVEPFVDADYWYFAKLLNAKNRPDSINVSLIFVSKRGLQNAQRKESASKKIVDSAYQELLAGGDFYEVATRRSDIPQAQLPDSGRFWMTDGSAERFFVDGSPVQMYFDTLYMRAPGSVVKVEYPVGTYIFRVNASTPFSPKVQVAVGKKQISASSETIDNIESAANNFVNGTTTYGQFDQKVTAEKLNRRSFERAAATSYSVPGLDATASRDVVRWAYDKDTKKGDVSNVFSFENMFVVAALKDIYPAGNAPLDMLRQYAETMVRRDKKAEILQQSLKETMSKTNDLAEIATQYGVETDTVTVRFADRNLGHYGAEAEVIGTLFGKEQVNSNMVCKGEMGVYVLCPIRYNHPEAMSASGERIERQNAIADRQKMMYQNQLQQGLTAALRKMYKVSDYRAKVF